MTDNRLPMPFTYMITSGRSNTENYTRQKLSILSDIERNTAQGVSAIQIREKELTARQVLDLAVEALSITRKTRTKLLINDRFDIAIAAGADGVHLTSTSVPLQVVRRYVDQKLLVSLSCHRGTEVAAASSAGASFVVYGPVFPTPGKLEPVGLEELSRVCRENREIPIAALGGINAANCQSALDAGAAGVAGIRVFADHQAAADLFRNVIPDAE